jgi:hypothetical protein
VIGVDDIGCLMFEQVREIRTDYPAQNPDLNAREFGASQTDGPQSLHQYIGEGSEQQVELIGVGGISTAIRLDTRFNLGSHDSADLILSFGMKYSGW